MKILLTHRYFWPDTAPYAFLLRAIGEDLSAEGHDVHVFCSKPSYRKATLQKTRKREQLGALNVYRCWVFQESGASAVVRSLNVFFYSWGLFFRILVLRPKLVTAATFPPVLAAYAAGLASKITGASFVYHLQDIHPEVSEISGGMMGKRIFANFFRWIDNQTLRRAKAIVVLSEDMANTLRDRGLGPLPIHIINNFALGDEVQLDSPKKEYAKPNGKRRIIFAGNLGRFQNLPVLTEGVALCLEKYADLELFFLGDGKVCRKLKEKWGHHKQIKFAPFLPIEQAKPLIAEADVGLVSLSESIYKVAYPSKISTYLAVGVPVVALTESRSELAYKLSGAGVAAIPESNSPEHISLALMGLLESKVSSQKVIRWYNENFSRALSIEKWRVIIDSL